MSKGQVRFVDVKRKLERLQLMVLRKWRFFSDAPGAPLRCLHVRPLRKAFHK